MFYGTTVQDTRPVFFARWQKHRTGQTLTPLEQQIVAVILCHPEYHEFFDQANSAVSKDRLSEPAENPFLHLGLHLALREQIATNRPAGIHDTFQQVAKKYGDPLMAEHQMIAILSEWLWRAQQDGMFSDQGYLAGLSGL